MILTKPAPPPPPPLILWHTSQCWQICATHPIHLYTTLMNLRPGYIFLATMRSHNSIKAICSYITYLHAGLSPSHTSRHKPTACPTLCLFIIFITQQETNQPLAVWALPVEGCQPQLNGHRLHQPGLMGDHRRLWNTQSTQWWGGKMGGGGGGGQEFKKRKKEKNFLEISSAIHALQCSFDIWWGLKST